jgi:preprotein translocase subunit SecG
LKNEVSVSALRLILEGLLVVTSLVLTLLILLHKGRGGGLSDMFGGGMSSTMGSSGVAERNLNRFTIGIALVWGTVIVLLNLMLRFLPDAF